MNPLPELVAQGDAGGVSELPAAGDGNAAVTLPGRATPGRARLLPSPDLSTTHSSPAAGQTQCAAILARLIEQRGRWVSMPELARVSGAYAVHSRISDLRKRGHLIEQGSERRGHTVLSYYMLLDPSALGPVSSVVGPESSVVGPESSVVGPVSSVVGPVSSVVGPVSSVVGPLSSV